MQSGIVKTRLFLLLLLLSGLFVNAQVIDPTSTFRTIDRASYFRFHYDNDFFTKTDYYYSQGISLEYVHPSLKKNPITKLLAVLHKSQTTNGVSLDLFAYTPTSIKSDSVLFGDRPYSACITARFFSISNNENLHQRLSSAITMGIIGPVAQGKEIQTGIHRWLHNKLPKGWQYQVQNDIVLNYQLQYEKQLFHMGDWFLLNTTAGTKLGTLEDKLNGAINLMIGHFNNPYTYIGDKAKKTSYYFFAQSRGFLTGYDASLQGGVFNRKSPYTISSGDISRLSFEADAGLILNFHSFFLSYTQSFLTKEFRTGLPHRWGGFSFGFSFAH